MTASLSTARKILASLILSLVSLLPLPSSAASAPTGLLCELLEHPEQTVITSTTPKFGWIYNPSSPNNTQSAYRIIVASTEALAESTNGDIWDSGLVTNAASINVPYSGPPLTAGASYFWRVATRDSTGQLSPFSISQYFQVEDPINGASINTWANRYPLGFVEASPVLITNTAPGRWFVDFGQDAFGYATVHANGTVDPAHFEVRFGEMATNSTVNTTPKGTVRYGVGSLVALKGSNAFYLLLPPRHTGQTISPSGGIPVVMPFRYLELINFPGALKADGVSQRRLISQFNPSAASFTSSSHALDRVWNLCHNSIKFLTFDGIYVDGDRERKPYEADAYIQQLGAYCMDREYTMPRYTFEYLVAHPTWPTEWSFHMVFIAWADYMQTGDTSLLEKHYATLKQKCLLDLARPDGLIQGKAPIIDWPEGERDGYVPGNCNAVMNAFYYRCLILMTDIARLTHHDADSADFAKRAEKVYRSFNTVFWNDANQRYIDSEGTSHSSDHANFFPLDFGLVPESRRASVLSFIRSRGMAPSPYGAQYLLEALFENDDADTALALMTTNSPRSWLNMLNEGSTLTTEAWSFAAKPNQDWNHAWGAAPANIIPRYVLGVRPLEAGFGRVLVQPQLGHALSHFEGVIPTVRGPISVRATKDSKSFELSVTVPGNLTADIALPSTAATNPVIFLDGARVRGAVTNHLLTIEKIGSGQHLLRLNF